LYVPVSFITVKKPISLCTYCNCLL